MNFQLVKLIIWPKNNRLSPRIVEFKPGKVNVITGASRTGKSAIIPIIDYCLASSDCFIPIDTIRDCASWYGVVFETETEHILISRKVPVGNKVSNDFYLLRGSTINIPLEITEPNEKSENVKHILNTIAGLPYLNLGHEGEAGFQSRLSFRDLMAFVFQNQDVVANQNILFYKTHAHKHRERLRNWFPYILGAETIEIIYARHRLQIVEKRLNQLTREYEKTTSVSDSWKNNLLGHLVVAKEYGLIEEKIFESLSPEELLEIARNVVHDIPEYSYININNVKFANKEALLLEEEELRISNRVAQIKKRLSNIKRLESGFVDYGGTLKKRVERLHISQWLEDIALESRPCPSCGSLEHPNNRSELKKISNSFKMYEEKAKSTTEVPNSFSREKNQVELELEELLKAKEDLQRRYDLKVSQDKKIQEEFYQKKNMFLFLGHLQASIETLESLAEDGGLQIEIDKLQKEYKSLLKVVNPSSVMQHVDWSTALIAQGILNYLQDLDVEEKYKKIAPKFSVKDLHISVLSDDNHWHFMAEVGSASNWVSFHIALMCSLQEYFLDQTYSCVPSFVVFDQPSQVYFPKLKRDSNEFSDDIKYDDEDVEAVKKIFATLANSVANQEGRWQSIVLDHADSTIYGDIEGVYEVEEWRNGKKLIPLEWY
ncbi:TPA: DUF3732 domain-containing protein [Bacillus thuringiensis]|nr:DUF3732 domain-containing protein [Bacillus thuringiensis]